MAVSQTINGWLRKIPAWPLYVLLPLPGIVAFYQALTGGLGPDPLLALEHMLGQTALQLIILTLLITPIRRWAGVSLLKFRRAIGVVAFVYVVAHFLTWTALDQRFDWAAIWEEIVERPYITIGMVGFLAMIPLAATSNNFSLRRLGSMRWNKLHRLAYLAAAAGALHYLLVVKAWPTEPIVYALIVALLLSFRAWWAANRKPRGPRSPRSRKPGGAADGRREASSA